MTVTKNKRFLFFTIALTTFLLINYIFVEKKIKKTITHTDIDFDSRSLDINLSMIKEFSGKYNKLIQKVTIDFKMKVYSISAFNNVFQTSRANTGIRMELSLPSNLGLIIGKSEDPSGFKSILLSERLKLNEWYCIKIKIDKEKNVLVLFDDNYINFQDKNLDYKISDIAVGSGFSKTRGFDGSISDFSIEYEILAETLIFSIIKILFFLSLATTIILLINYLSIFNFFNRLNLTSFYDRSNSFSHYVDPFIKVKENLILLFFLVFLSVFITFGLYYLLSQIFYFPNGVGGKEVFFSPRYGGGMNDLPSGIFKQWNELIVVFPILICIIIIALKLASNKKYSFWKYLLIIYFFALIFEFSFLFLTANGLEQLELQTKSINNGIWYSMDQISNQTPIKNSNMMGKIRFIYTELGCNDCGYTLPGTRHPPGSFIISFSILWVANKLFFFLRNPAIAWGIFVSLLNTFLVVVIAILAKEAFSNRIAKLGTILLLTTPSLALHFCSMIDGIASLFFSISILFTVFGLKYIYQNRAKDVVSINKIFWYGIGTGIFSVLSAQMSYGHAFPIFSLLIAFIFFIDKSKFRRVSFFLIGVVLPSITYFVFEYYISGGTSFWITRAIKIAGDNANYLSFRPYPLSQVANFVVLSVMGGILFLATLIFVCNSIFKSSYKFVLKKYFISNSRRMIRAFFILLVFIMLVFLILQNSVRLEAERILHWFFVPVWALSPIFLISFEVLVKKLLNRNFIANYNIYFLVLYITQLLITIALAMGIQDYY